MHYSRAYLSDKRRKDEHLCSFEQGRSPTIVLQIEITFSLGSAFQVLRYLSAATDAKDTLHNMCLVSPLSAQPPTQYPRWAYSSAGLVMDKAGNLYGTTEFGGCLRCGVPAASEPCSSWIPRAPRPCCIASRSCPMMGQFPMQAWSWTRRATSTAPRISVALPQRSCIQISITTATRRVTRCI